MRNIKYTCIRVYWETVQLISSLLVLIKSANLRLSEQRAGQSKQVVSSNILFVH